MTPNTYLGARIAQPMPCHERGYCEEDGELLDDDAVDNFFDAKMYSVMVEPTDNVSVDVEILRVHLNGGKYEGDNLVLGSPPYYGVAP